ncbi:MAG: exodeoxyribonuclease VII large subunit [Acidimicrobiales bacterium]
MTLTDAGTFSVGELCATLKLAFEQLFPEEIWVRGEVSNLSRPSSGHVYFDLVERAELGRPVSAKLPVALLADRKYVVNQILKRAGGAVRMTDGVEVRLRGRVDFYPPSGRLSLLMTLIDPAYTLGQLAADRDRLLRQLDAEGLLGRQQQIWLSPAPLRVGLVTSRGSAAEQDVLHELASSGLGFELRTFHAQVQGNGAAESVVRALAAAHRHGCELVLLVRGGGARTDLATFDAEIVARAVATSEVPIWTGIGHEIDRSVADELAQRAFKTPTAAAAALVERVGAFLGQLDARWQMLRGLARTRLERAEAELNRGALMVVRDGRTALRGADSGLAARQARISVQARHLLDRAQSKLELAEAKASGADPQRALARGFSLTRRAADGALVRHPDQVTPGEELLTELAQGVLHSTARYGETQ